MERPRPRPSDAARFATPRELTVADLMTKDVVTIRGDASIHEAIAMLADSHVGGIAVTESHHRLVGVISASDILSAEAELEDDEARARLHSTGLVSDVMSPRPLTIGPAVAAREAALQMDYADVHRLFVVVDDALVGVISRSDINRAVAAGRPL